jgi:dolichol-phosphate mannosyltransferase
VADSFSVQYVELGAANSAARLIRHVAPDWIFHLATYGAYPFQTDFDRAFEANVVATIDFVRAALSQGVESLVLAGTSSEYGPKDHPPVETEGLDPISFYASTKAAATLMTRQLAVAASANVAILRLYSIYGPFEEPTRLIPSLVAESWSNQLPMLAGPDAAHDFVYVDDAIEAFIRVAEARNQPGAIYNVSSETQSSLRLVVDTVRDVLGVTAEPAWGSMPPRPWDTSVWLGDSGSLRKTTGWVAEHSLGDGLVKFSHWFDSIPGMRERYLNARRAQGVGEATR